MEDISIFDYSDHLCFLNTYFEKKKKANPYFSIRLWVRKLGLNSPSSLHMVLTGKRLPGKLIIAKLVDYFNFDDEEKAYFESLVHLAKFKSYDHEKNDILEEMKSLISEKPFAGFDDFNEVLNWYYDSVCKMIKTKDSASDPDWLRKKSKYSLSLNEVKTSFDNLNQVLNKDKKTNSKFNSPAYTKLATMNLWDLMRKYWILQENQ